MALKVNEIFYSIQGESSFAGFPCVFVRLTGCNLRCTYCDTKYAYHEGRTIEIDKIMEQVSAYRCHLVEITGGEPLMQEKTPDLIEKLINKGFTVLLETNGSKDLCQIDDRCVKIMDVKCPSSGEKNSTDFNNFTCLSHHDEIKFVIASSADYQYAKEIFFHLHGTHPGKNKVHFAPVFGEMEIPKIAQWILDDHLEVRLHVQLHKMIWDPKKRGV